MVFDGEWKGWRRVVSGEWCDAYPKRRWLDALEQSDEF
jgi:hypothetical protein